MSTTQTTTETATQPETHITTPDNRRLVFTAHASPIVSSEATTSSLKRLIDEWNGMSTRPSALRRANSWGLPGEPVSNLDEIVVRAGFGGPITCDEADQYLAALVRIAKTDDLAARAVLHRVIPPMISIASRRGHRRREEVDDAMTRVLAQAWMIIRSYPSERRPRKIAANIVRDIEYKEFVASARVRKAVVEYYEPDDVATQAASIASHEVSIHTGPTATNEVMNDLERRKIDPQKLAILRLLSAGYTSGEIATKLNMRPRTVRWQRTEALAIAREVHTVR